VSRYAPEIMTRDDDQTRKSSSCGDRGSIEEPGGQGVNRVLRLWSYKSRRERYILRSFQGGGYTPWRSGPFSLLYE